MSTGTENGTAVLTSGEQGAGTRLLWYPGKAAFRAGGVSGTKWNDASVGTYSVAMGADTTASFPFSVALGQGSTASNSGAIALGMGPTSSGYASFASGVSTVASGDESNAMGYYTTASGQGSFAQGYLCSSIGLLSFASGFYSASYGTYSTAMSGGYANGTYSVALGGGTLAASYESCAVGTYNKGLSETGASSNATAWVSTDPMFEVGIGTGAGANAKDALVVYKDGNAQVHGTFRCAAGGDLAMGSFTAGTAP